jgi:ketosteroid isomerase-like protein
LRSKPFLQYLYIQTDVAFATATGRCVDVDPKGKREELEFRLTMGLKKIDGRWRVMHEHHSLPAV